MASSKAVIVLLMIVIIALFAIYLTVLVSQDPSNMPSDTRQQDAISNLLSGENLEVAAPERTNWAPGSTGRYSMGLLNGEVTDKTFYSSVYLRTFQEIGGDQVPATQNPNWWTYQETLQVPAGKIQTSELTLHVPADAPLGTYRFILQVCEDSPCSGTGSGVVTYATAALTVRVREV